MDAPFARTGWLDAATRVARPLLRSPRIKTQLRIVLDHIDPESAPDLVRTLLWTDAEIPLALVGAAPRLVNVGIAALDELSLQVRAFPSALLAQVLADSGSQIQARALGKSLGRLVAIFASLPPRSAAAAPGPAVELWAGLVDGLTEAKDAPTELRELLTVVTDRVAAAVERGHDAHPNLVPALSTALRRVLADHPRLVDRVLLPLVAPIQQALEQSRQRER